MKLRPTEILAAFASAVSLLNLAKDFVELEEALRHWINLYDRVVALVFSFLEPFTSLPGFEITVIERHLIIIFFLPTAATIRGLTASPTSRQYKAGARQTSAGGLAQILQTAFMATTYALLFVIIFAIAPATVATIASALLLSLVFVRSILVYPDKGLRQFRIALIVRQLLQLGAAVILLLFLNEAVRFIASL
jgi:hypothetical protein